MSGLSTAQEAKLTRTLSRIKHIILVLSGKGGVGKSSVSVQLALTLKHTLGPQSRIGLLDVDLTGPSLPRMLGLQGESVRQSSQGWVPVEMASGPEGQEGQAEGGIMCMSIGFLLKTKSESVVWRGPKKTAMIRQFLYEVDWGELDWLVIDTPPGTSDEHISLLETLLPLLPNPSNTSTSASALRMPTLHSVIVTTPQAVSLTDVSKELSFARKTNLPVTGLIENMSGYVCPHCGDVISVFGRGGGEELCRLENEKRERGEGEGLRFLGRIPIDRALVAIMDQAAFSQAATNATNGSSDSPAASEVPPSEPTTNGSLHAQGMVERYVRTPTFPIFSAIARGIVDVVEGREPLPPPPLSSSDNSAHH